MSKQQQNSYPPVAFNFKLQVLGLEDSIDCGFQEISGIKTFFKPDVGIEEINTQKAISNFTPLVLKRAMPLNESKLTNWALNVLEFKIDKSIKCEDVLVSLLNEKGQPVLSWKFINAFPIEWGISSFNALENNILYETIILKYDYFIMV